MLSRHMDLLEQSLFARHLSMMMKGGMDLPESLGVLEKESSSSAVRTVLGSILADLKRGTRLSVSLARHPKDFNLFFASVIEVSEESGTLVENLDVLSKQLSREFHTRKKVQGVLLYPILVLVASAIVGILMSVFILPKFLVLFVSLNVDLPLSTRILMGITEILQKYWVIGLVIGIWLLVLCRVLLSVPRLELLWHHIRFRIPFLGVFVRNVVLSQFFRGLGVMMKSGIPLSYALKIESRSMTNRVFVQYAQRMEEGIVSGYSIAQLIERKEMTHIPPLAEKMIAVGERTGKLDESFFFLAEFFDEEADFSSRRFVAALEPTMLFVIAIVVLFIALSVITPIYSLTGSFT